MLLKGMLMALVPAVVFFRNVPALLKTLVPPLVTSPRSACRAKTAPGRLLNVPLVKKNRSTVAVEVRMAVPALFSGRCRNRFAEFVSPILRAALDATFVAPVPLIVPPAQFTVLLTVTSAEPARVPFCRFSVDRVTPLELNVAVPPVIVRVFPTVITLPVNVTVLAMDVAPAL